LVAKGILTIRAERREDLQSQHRSEFRYGTFSRHLPLPVTADADDIKATYHWGILQVSIGLHDADEDRAGRRIPVQTAASGRQAAQSAPASLSAPHGAKTQNGPTIATGRQPSRAGHRSSSGLAHGHGLPWVVS
jgi:hypothetical protein